MESSPVKTEPVGTPQEPVEVTTEQEPGETNTSQASAPQQASPPPQASTPPGSDNPTPPMNPQGDPATVVPLALITRAGMMGLPEPSVATSSPILFFPNMLPNFATVSKKLSKLVVYLVMVCK